MKPTQLVIAFIAALATMAGAYAAECNGHEAFCYDFSHNISGLQQNYNRGWCPAETVQWSSDFGGSLEVAADRSCWAEGMIMTDFTEWKVGLTQEFVLHVTSDPNNPEPRHEFGLGINLFNATFAPGEMTDNDYADNFDWEWPALHGENPIPQSVDCTCISASGSYCESGCIWTTNQGDYIFVKQTRLSENTWNQYSIDMNDSRTFNGTVDMAYVRNLKYGGLYFAATGEASGPWQANVLYYKMYNESAPTCDEEWISHEAAMPCNGTYFHHLKTYTDENQCGTFAHLPQDNGSMTPTTFCGPSETSASHRGEVQYCDQAGTCYSSLAAAQAALNPPALSIGGLPASSQGFWNQILAWISTGWKTTGGFP